MFVMDWVQSYVTSHAPGQPSDSTRRVFYSVCQTVFYIVCFHHRQLRGRGGRGRSFLARFHWEELLTSHLNPIKVVTPPNPACVPCPAILLSHRLHLAGITPTCRVVSVFCVVLIPPVLRRVDFAGVPSRLPAPEAPGFLHASSRQGECGSFW